MSHIIIYNIHEGDGEVYTFRRGGHVWVCVVFGSVKIRHISSWSVYYMRLAGTEIHDEIKCPWTIWMDYFWTFDFHALLLVRLFIIVSFPIYRFHTKYASDYIVLLLCFYVNTAFIIVLRRVLSFVLNLQPLRRLCF